MTETTQEHVLDVRGQHCPMPVVKSAKAIKELAPGEVLTVLATDRGSITDIPAWALARPRGRRLARRGRPPRLRGAQGRV